MLTAEYARVVPDEEVGKFQDPEFICLSSPLDLGSSIGNIHHVDTLQAANFGKVNADFKLFRIDFLDRQMYRNAGDCYADPG